MPNDLMNRRDALAAIGMAAATARPASTPAQTSHASERRVNILFLMDDQHRGDCIGAAGAGWIHTPNLDRLASAGALFRKAYTSLPSCLPARATLLTGKSPWAHGLLGYSPIPPRYEYEKPRMFTDAGYRTHAIGKMHFEGNEAAERVTHGYQSILLEEAWRGSGDRTFRCDYRQWFEKRHPDKDVDATGLGYTDHRGGKPWLYDEALHPTRWTADRAITFLNSYGGEQPWFLKVSFKRPHPPFDPPRRWLEFYNDVRLPMPQAGEWADSQHGHIGGSLEETPNATRGRFPGSEVHAARQAYFASVSHVDEQVGRIMQALERRGELENTLVLFTADHGDMMGDNHLWRKCYAYEPSARVPMIVRWPDSLGIQAGRGQRLDHLVELRDVLPTFLDAGGVNKPEEMDGMSILDLLRNGGAGWRETLDLEHAAIYWDGNAWVALTDGRYKYIYFTLTGKQQLFDLWKDPHELHNLAESQSHSRRLRHWRERMVKHLEIRGEPWVSNGDLAVQSRSIMHGPNFPDRS